jgi:hypothetical protein
MTGISIHFEPTFKLFVDTLSMLLHSLYESASTIPRAEIKLGWVDIEETSELLKVYISYIILNCTYYYMI